MSSNVGLYCGFEELYTLGSAKAERNTEEKLVFHIHALQEIKVNSSSKIHMLDNCRAEETVNPRGVNSSSPKQSKLFDFLKCLLKCNKI